MRYTLLHGWWEEDHTLLWGCRRCILSLNDRVLDLVIDLMHFSERYGWLEIKFGWFWLDLNVSSPIDVRRKLLRLWYLVAYVSILKKQQKNKQSSRIESFLNIMTYLFDDIGWEWINFWLCNISQYLYLWLHILSTESEYTKIQQFLIFFFLLARVRMFSEKLSFTLLVVFSNCFYILSKYL